MFTLAIDPTEAELLRHVLRSHLAALLAEISAADSRDFKAHLRERYEAIDAILHRIPVQLGTEIEEPVTPLL